MLWQRRFSKSCNRLGYRHRPLPELISQVRQVTVVVAGAGAEMTVVGAVIGAETAAQVGAMEISKGNVERANRWDTSFGNVHKDFASHVVRKVMMDGLISAPIMRPD